MKTKRINWKKVAAERLEKIRIYERRRLDLRNRMRTVIQVKLQTAMHAHCIQSSVWLPIAADVAKSVAERMTPEI